MLFPEAMKANQLVKERYVKEKVKVVIKILAYKPTPI